MGKRITKKMSTKQFIRENRRKWLAVYNNANAIIPNIF